MQCCYLRSGMLCIVYGSLLGALQDIWNETMSADFQFEFEGVYIHIWWTV